MLTSTVPCFPRLLYAMSLVLNTLWKAGAVFCSVLVPIHYTVPATLVMSWQTQISDRARATTGHLLFFFHAEATASTQSLLIFRSESPCIKEKVVWAPVFPHCSILHFFFRKKMVTSVLPPAPRWWAAPEDKKVAKCFPREISNVDPCVLARHFFPSYL